MASETWSQILSTKDARLCGQDEWERASEHSGRTGMTFTDRLAGEEEVAWGELGHGFYFRYEYDDTGGLWWGRSYVKQRSTYFCLISDRTTQAITPSHAAHNTASFITNNIETHSITRPRVTPHRAGRWLIGPLSWWPRWPHLEASPAPEWVGHLKPMKLRGMRRAVELERGLGRSVERAGLWSY